MKPIQEANERNKIWRNVNQQQLRQTITNELYTFDQIYNEHMSTPEIFEGQFKNMILQALNGYNVTIFAYGQTSSGKTHTMIGEETELGIIALSAQEIFRKIKDTEGTEESHLDEARKFGSIVPAEAIKKSVKVIVSFFEIYNENINDLLDPSKKNLQIREDKVNQQVNIEGVTKYEVSDSEHILALLHRGSELKKMASTKMNS